MRKLLTPRLIQSLTALGLVASPGVLAQQGPAALNISGTLLQPNGATVSSNSVNFRLEIWDQANTCRLYSEEHLAVNLGGAANGAFSLVLGGGTTRQNFIASTTALNAAVFLNPGNVPAFAGCTAPPTLNAGDARSIHIFYDLGSGMTAMTPDVPIVSTAYAIVAETLQGKTADQFLQVNNTGSTSLSQANTEYAFSAVNWPKLKALLDGNSTQYNAASPTAPVDNHNQRLVNVADPLAAQDAATKNYVDTTFSGKPLDVSSTGPMTGDGRVVMWDSTNNKWTTGFPTAAGAAGGDLTGSYPNPTIATGVVSTAKIANDAISSAKISSTGVAVNRLVMTDATTGSTLGFATCGQNEILKFDVATGWTCVTVSSLAPVVSVAGKTGAVALNAGDIGGLGTASLRDYGTAAGQVILLDGSARLPAVDASLLTNVNSTTLQGRAVAATAPLVDQVLGWNSSTMAWEPRAFAAAPVTSVAGRTGAITLDVGDLTSATGKYFTYQPNNIACANTQTMKWDGTKWLCADDLDSGGDITAVNAGAGLLGGGLTGAVTLAVDVGTIASKILQLNGSAQIPAVDGSLLLGVNAVRLQSRAVAAVAPIDGQVLKWNSSSLSWEPSLDRDAGISALSGDVVAAGPGAAVATIQPDAITSAKINSTGIAINRLLITDSTTGASVKYADQCAVGEILKWSATGWACAAEAGSTGFVTKVASGVGLVGGPITSTGTLSVDVGTAANKILQLNGSAQIPAVDGSLLTSVNAVKLQTRVVAATAPTAGQVLAWNTSLSQWEPTLATAGSVTNIQTANGILGGPITSTGTISVDTGTTASKILQLNPSAQIPAVDASLLFNVNASKIATRAVALTAPTVGQVLGWNVTSTQWEPVTASTGSVQNVSSGVGLLGGPITQNGTLSVDVGTAANKILQLNGSAQVPAVDGSLIANINAVKLQTRAIAATAPTAGQVLAWNTSLSQWEPTLATAGSVTNIQTSNGLLGGPITSTGTISVDTGTIANKVMQLNGSAQIPAVDASLLFNVNASKIATRTVASTAPTVGQVLGWNVTSTQWEPVTASTGSVQNISSGLGLLGGPITQNGTLSVDVGTAANKILQLNGSAQIPAVDGSLLTSVNAVKLQTRAVAATAPTAGQVLAWNTSLSQWEPTLATAGSVTNIQTANGLLGGPITSTGTLSVDTGTTASKILQLNGTAQIPAVDASLLFNVNASKLATRPVALTAPTVGQVLGWNVTSTQWEPVTAATGSVQNVSSGVGLLGGPITQNGTLSVDVGTAANKILQLNGSAQIPAVDGSLLASVNAVKLQARAIAATAPTAGQVLAWNTSLSQWEPTLATAGAVTNIQTANGLLGGPITSTGTISVDTGTIASKILQLNGSAQIPAVDASLLYNVNASKLATRPVALTAPTVGQVLGWNVTSTQWEPVTASTGSVQNVSSGVGLLGGPITQSGTLSVDVGTAAGKILQLNGSAQIPAVDGSLLTGVNAVKLQTRAVAATAPTAGQVLAWNTSLSQWEPTLATAGSVTNIQTANGLLGGPITSTGTLSVDTGTIANKILQLNGSAQIPAVDGSLLFNVNASKIATRPVASTAPTVGQVLGWNVTTTQWEPVTAATGSVQSVASGTGLLGGPITQNGTLSVDVGTAANKILQLNGAAQIPAVDGSLLTSVNAVKLQTRAIAATAPTAGQVLAWNTSLAQWEPTLATAGAVTNIQTANGLLGGPITSTGTLSVDTGTIANKILQLNGSAQIPAVDGSLLLNVNASKIATRTVASTAPTVGQVLGWNVSASQWEPITAATGSVQNVASGTGLLGGPITQNGTLSVDVGTAANKILQLNGTAQIPAVDGSLLTSVNAVKLQTRAVSATAPGAGQVLGWNVTSTQWEPVSAATGSVQTVASGTGLLGGPITQNGTLSVDVGTAANKILQLNGTAQIPAVDGSLLTGVNAVKLQTRTVAATAPTAGQVLGWNTSLSQWEPTVASTGSVTNIQTANGLLGGPITTNGTISVDTGTIANKILQLNASAQIPTVDASLLFNVNASKIATRTVALTAPTTGQVLGWNTSATQWEPVSAATGSVQNVSSGLGLLGGPITSNGTLTVDVGSAAGKIVQENANAQIAQTFGTAALPAYSFAGNTATGLFSPGTNQLSLSTNGSAALSVLSNGFVGIGSAAPVSALDVNGTLSFVGSSGASVVGTGAGSMTLNSAGGGTSLRYAGANRLTFTNDITLASNTSGSIVLMNGVNEVMRATGGEVGIGTNNPLAGLDVATTGTAGSAIIVPRDSTTNRPSAPVNGMLRYNNTLNVMEGYINGAWSTLSSGSSAGTVTNIATSTGLLGGPITTNGTLSVDVGTAANKIPQLNANAQLALSAGTASSPAHSFAGDSTTGMYQPSTGALALSSSGTARLNVLANGNIGVGTSAPAAQLDLLTAPTATSGSINQLNLGMNPALTSSSTASFYGINQQTTIGSGETQSYSVLGGVSGLILNQGAGAVSLLSGSSATVNNYGSGSVTSIWGDYANARSYGSGNVTTSIGSQVVSGAGGGYSGTITTAVGVDAKIFNTAGTINSAYAGRFAVNTNNSVIANAYGVYVGNIYGTNKWSVYASDATSPSYFAANVGIGTATPLAALDVNATGSASAIIVPRDSTANRPATPVNGMLRYNNSLNVMEGYINGAWSALSSGSSAGTVTNIATSTGLLGGPITTNGTLSVDVGTAASKIPQLNANAQLALAAGTVAAPTYAFGTDVTTGAYAPAVGTLALVTSGTARLNILANGSVGIGTAAPDAKFQIGAKNLVNGTQSLRIQGSGNLATPDTVFSSLDFFHQLSAGNNQATARILSRGKSPSAGVAGGLEFYTGLFNNTETFNASAAMAIDQNGNVGIGTTLPQSVLDIATTGTAGSAILLPRDSTANRPTTAVNGMLRYNNSLNVMEGYINGAWSALASGSSAGGVTNIATGTGLLGGPITTTGTLSVDVGSAANKIVRLNANAQSVLLAGTEAAPTYSFSAYPGSGLYASMSNQLALAVNGTAGLTIGNGGVGIGTFYPVGNLDVTTSSSGSVSMFLQNRGTGPAIQQINTYAGGTPTIQMNQQRASGGATQVSDLIGSWSLQGYTGSGTGGGASLNVTADANYTTSSTPASLIFATNPAGSIGNTEKMRITGAGFVGIGTASPSTLLDVMGSGSTDTRIRVRNGTNGGDLFSSGGVFAMGSYNGPTSLLSNNQERVRIDAAGNIGFNTTTPLAALDFNASGTSGTAIIVPRDSTANRPGTPVNGMIRYNTTLSAMEGYVSGAWSTFATGASSGTVTNVAAGTGLLGGPITTTGTLTVDVGSAANKIVRENANAQIAQTLGTVALPSYTFAGNPNTGLYSAGTNQLNLAVNGSAALTINATGQIGFGTTSPYYDLDITKANTNTAINAQNSSSTAARYPSMQVNNFDGTGFGGIPAFNLINARGSVASPVALSSGDGLGIMAFYGQKSTTAGDQVTGATISSYASAGWTSTSAPADLIFGTTAASTTSSAEKMRLMSTGKLGIGTNNPTAKLEVSGAIVSREVVVASGATADFSQGNSVVMQSVGGATITVSNLVAGGTYNLIIEDTTSRTYTISGCGTVYYSPANGATTNRTVYSIYRRSASCYVSWVTGYN